jgi:glucans biosynthesis protein
MEARYHFDPLKGIAAASASSALHVQGISMKQIRIYCPLTLFYIIVATPLCIAATDDGMDLLRLTARVQELATRSYDPETRAVPDFLTRLGYDEYRDFKFKPDHTLWHDEQLPFELEFFHPGYIYPHSVAMYAIGTDGSLTAIPFSSDLFEYGPQADLIPLLPEQLDFSGFHVWHTTTDGALERIGLFQGASYFRMVSSFNEYGLSARALAINTTNPPPEEFPEFTTFWFEKPQPNATDFVFYGLAESSSVVAGYRFVLTPGTPIQMHVEARVVLRQAVEELGLTPFSTMFWYGENTARRPADFRPEVHDSDGLFIETADELIWRPISNPARTRTDSLPGDSLKAFGLQQRDRDYEHYQDIEADYHLRPDAWIVPGAGMQEGSLRLLEIESPHEYADNVALVWVPAKIPQPQELFSYDYDIYFGERPADSLASVVATRYGESLRGDGSIEFVIDFKGEQLDSLPEDTELTIDSSIEGGEFVWQNIRKNPHNDTWRLNLRVLPGASQEIRLRASLNENEQRVSETWTYWWFATP